jgi:putative ATP-dependent endonuclease of OLD family
VRIEKVEIANFRNFEATTVFFKASTLVIGANDIGKTNLIFALRLLLDKSLSERDIEPSETDFHIKSDGSQASNFSILIQFSDIQEEAVLSVLRGYVSDDSKTVFKLTASKRNLDYKFYAGSNETELEEINNRFYLKYINLRYIRSQRDLQKFIDIEKKHLLKISQSERDTDEITTDNKQLDKIGKSLNVVNERVRRLNYVKSSTDLVNDELKKLAHTFNDYGVHLDSGAIQVQQFIDNLQLSASSNGSKIMLGGDGRNNQILLALWKAKSQREHDPDHEVVFYCVEEPEAHLHPHQQRKLADYLINELPGQTLITSHSPQITARYPPDSIAHIINRGSGSYAASNGCSECISDAWDELGYRMSILPAEAFFSRAVLLVEGPSEQLFYTELAKENGIDLDFYNISILPVDGVQFKVYVNVLNAMEIPWVLRTDNDVSKITVQGVELRNLAGINRCLDLLSLPKYSHANVNTTAQSLVQAGIWQNVSNQINPQNTFISKVDLENDLADEMSVQLLAYTGKNNVDDAIKYMAGKKAIRMREFLNTYKGQLNTLRNGELAKPLLRSLEIVQGFVQND